MDNTLRKLFATKQQKGCEFMPKMHQNTFLSPDPLGSICAPPDPLAAMEGLILRGTDGGERGRKGRGKDKGASFPILVTERWARS